MKDNYFLNHESWTLMSFRLTTIVKLPLNIFTVLHYRQLLLDIFQYVNNFLYLQCLEIEVHF